MMAIELGSTVRRAHVPNLLTKKSFSIVSCPILGSSPRTSLGVKLLDLARRRRLGVEPNFRIERPRRVVLQLFLPRINLPPDQVRGLVALPQIVHRRLLAQRLGRNLRLQPRINLPSRLRHAPLRSMPFGADFLHPSHWS